MDTFFPDPTPFRSEYREALEERDGARRLAGFRRAPAFVVQREAVGIDDGGSALALADIAAEPERLAEGQPALAGEATLDDGAPEDQDVDPGVAPLGRGILRHGERRLGFRGHPRLYPGNADGLQLGAALVGDFLLADSPVVPGTGPEGGSVTRGAPPR